MVIPMPLQRSWRDYARGTFLVAVGKAAKAFSKLLELSFERERYNLGQGKMSKQLHLRASAWHSFP